MAARKPLTIAMIGSRGLPRVYGGIERHIEELGSRLAARGRRVIVFGRRPFSDPGMHRGMEIRVLPAIATKSLETATNACAASLRTVVEPIDIVHFHGIGPSLFSWLPAAAGKPTVATVHALDYRQSKWGAGAKALLRLGERMAVRHSSAPIAVSRILARQLSEAYGREVRYIPNGAAIKARPPFAAARGLGLEPGRYVLTVGRFIVERNFHALLEAYGGIETDVRLVIVGDARYESGYEARIRALADSRVVFPGYIGGALLDELYAHCAFYVLPSLVEGLPISLLEAMSFGAAALVSDIPENLEVAGGIAVTFRHDDTRDLGAALARMLAMGESERRALGSAGLEKVEREYSWERIADEVDRLYESLAGPR